MIQKLFNLFSVLGDRFALFMISLIPLIEERGAIIFGAARKMPWYEVLPICIVSNLAGTFPADLRHENRQVAQDH